MKVLAVNSSPRGDGQSKTELMLDHLVKGMREAGAEVEVVELRKRKVNNCTGCFTCWTKTPGVCIHKDDMSKELFPKYVESDLIVMATPLYHYTVNALLKTFIERTLPVAEPFLELRDGVTRHPRRHPQKPVVAISVAGFPEYSVFDQLSSYMNYLFKDKLVAEIYRTSSEIMSVMMKEGKVKDALEATVQGGRELVESMKISDETMERINQPISDFESMAPMAVRTALVLVGEQCDVAGNPLASAGGDALAADLAYSIGQIVHGPAATTRGPARLGRREGAETLLVIYQKQSDPSDAQPAAPSQPGLRRDAPAAPADTPGGRGSRPSHWLG